MITSIGKLLIEAIRSWPNGFHVVIGDNTALAKAQPTDAPRLIVSAYMQDSTGAAMTNWPIITFRSHNKDRDAETLELMLEAVLRSAVVAREKEPAK